MMLFSLLLLAEAVDPMAAMLERIRSGNVALKKVQESVGTVYASLVLELHQCASSPPSPCD